MKISVLTIALVVLLLGLQSTASAQESAQNGGIKVISHSRQEQQLLPSSYQLGDVQVQWIAHYVGPDSGSHEAMALAVDQAGNVYVAGKYDRAGRLGDSFDYLTLKYNTEGVEQWAVRYDGPSSSEDRASVVAVDNSGNVYVNGTCSAGDYDFGTIKYNSSGVQQWVKRYDGPSQGADFGAGITRDASGNVYVTGNSEGADYPVVGSDYDFATIKYNSDGTVQWVARYDGSLRSGTVNIIVDDVAGHIAVDNNGNVYVTGKSGDHICTVKYNAQGIEQWVKSYTGYSNYAPVGVAVDANGNTYVAGTVDVYETGEDIVAIKYNANGVEQWVSTYTNPGDDYDHVADMIVDGSGNMFVCGYSKVSGKSNFITIKFTTGGVQKWIALHASEGSYSNSGQALTMDGAGNIYVTGYSQMAASSYDFVTIKYDASGQQQWLIHYDNNKGFETAEDIEVDADGGVIVTGYETMWGWHQITTIRYSQLPVAVEDDRAIEPSSFRLSQNYPNPFNSVTLIEYQLQKPADVELVICDLTGHEVWRIAEKAKPAGCYQTRWDGRNVAGQIVGSGVYLYRIEMKGKENRYTEVKKMIIMK
jgi:uncharacterized delta-60 repeat protein